MNFEEIDMRTPRERVNDNLLHQQVGEEYRSVSYRQKDGGARGGSSGCCVDKRDYTDTRKMPEQRRHSWGLCEYPLGMVYVPIQVWRGLYALDTGFDHGTIFRELDLPFLASTGRGGYCRG